MIHRHRPIAFTLIETILVIAILGILSTAAALSLAEPLRKARTSEAIAQVIHADASARAQAKRFNRAIRLVVDLQDRTIARRMGDDLSHPVALPRSYGIVEVRTRARRQGSGEAGIDISAIGLSESYALRLSGPKLDQWLFFSGLTGHCSPVSDETRLSHIFDALGAHAR